ncbi:hypothetical protein ACLKA7_011684 [Drosophila subpalustris]
MKRSSTWTALMDTTNIGGIPAIPDRLATNATMGEDPSCSNNNNNNNSENCNSSIILSESQRTLSPGSRDGEGAGAVVGTSVDHSFVAIPLLERRRRSRSHSRCHIAPLAPIICIQTGAHPEDLTQLSRSVSCFVRFRRSFAKFFAKIMGSNNPSEADRYDYYDSEHNAANATVALNTQDVKYKHEKQKHQNWAQRRLGMKMESEQGQEQKSESGPQLRARAYCVRSRSRKV